MSSNNVKNNFVVWFTGLSGSGKTTLSENLKKRLENFCMDSFILDGDILRTGLCSDLGFCEKSRAENIRRVGEVSKLFFLSGQNVICSFISPFEKERKFVKDLIGEDNFIEVFVNCPLEICESRDVKGLYKKARDGVIKEFTGISSPYENPKNPDLEIRSDLGNVDICIDLVIDELIRRGFLK